MNWVGILNQLASEIQRAHLLGPFVFLLNSINGMKNKAKSGSREVTQRRDDDKGDERENEPFYPVQSSNNDEGSGRLHQEWEKTAHLRYVEFSDTEVIAVQVKQL